MYMDFFIVPDKKLRKIPVYKLGVINFQFYNIAIPYFVSFYHKKNLMYQMLHVTYSEKEIMLGQ